VASKTVTSTKFRKTNASQGRIPCVTLTKFSGFVCGHTMIDPYFKFGGIRLRGSKAMEV